MFAYIVYGAVVATLVALPQDVPALANPFYAAGVGIVAMLGAAWLADRRSTA